jgi:hypothetical protein
MFTSQYFESHDSPVCTLEEALIYRLPELQFDLGGNFGVKNEMPRIRLYAGVSQG